MASSTASDVVEETCDTPQLPPWLARHVRLAFDADDVAALINSIESSQNPPSSLANLPAELLLQVLEYVPVGYLLDWRLVCRGFRDAIDGRILYHHLQRTQLVGYLGPRTLWPLQNLTDEQYNQIRFFNANFLDVEKIAGAADDSFNNGPIWRSTHAVFNIEHQIFRTNPEEDDDPVTTDSITEYAGTIWRNAQSRLELSGVEEGFGTLRWCIKLDQAVLDLDFPLEATRNSFDVTVDLHNATVKVAWRDMLFQFLKTEAALRRMLDQKQDSKVTFSLDEDCLREVRRQRLHASLNPENKVDRHLKWSLRLLRPLFGRPQQNHSPLELAENTAVNALLYLRREAAMSTSYIAYLHQLSSDLKTMEASWDEIEEEFSTFRTHLFPQFAQSLVVPTQPDELVPYNPIAWPDDLRTRIEERVSKWKSQQKVIEQMRALLASSNQALAVPEDSFDDVFSDI